MTNVLSDEKRQQVLALGRLGWTLRRIEEATGVRRETASATSRPLGWAVRAPRAAGGRLAPPKPAKEVSTDPGAAAGGGAARRGPPAPGRSRRRAPASRTAS